MGRTDLAKHRRGRGRIGRGHDGAQDEGDGEGDRRPEDVRHDRDGHDGEAHRDHDQPGERRPVVAQVAQRRIVGRVEQYWGHEERQREPGVERHARDAGGEGERGPTDSQQRGIGRTDAPGQRRQKNRPEEQHDHPFEEEHRPPEPRTSI